MKISIITAVYNGRDTIASALESVARQDYGNVEYVVVDGGSQDGTAQFLELHRDGIDVLVSERDEGIYDALNKGIRMSSGDIVGFLHADDVFANDQVLSLIARAFEHPEVGAVFGDIEYVDKCDMNRVIRKWRAGTFSRRKLGWGWMPPHPTFYVRRSVYAEHGLFDTRYRIAADYDCMLRFLRDCRFEVAYISEVLVRMRVGGASNRSIANILRKSREDYMALRTNCVGGLAALCWKNLSKLPQFLHWGR